MKTVVRILVVCLLLTVALPLALVNAQGDGGEYTMAPTISAVYYIPATAGSFEEVDDAYLLTLAGVAEEIEWIMASPMLSIYTFSNVNFNAQWVANDELVADAVLQVADLNVQLALSSPAYDVDTGTQTYVAEVTDIIGPADAKEIELPMEFEAVTLTIAWTDEFQGGLIDGIAAMYEGMRATPEQCAAAQASYDQFQNVWLPERVAAHDALIWPCLLDGDAAACQLMNDISMEMAFEQMAMAQVLSMINNECN